MINTIYVLRNLTNNKIYIGQTWLSLTDRWNNGRGYKRNPYLYAAIKKHGKSNFRYEILTQISLEQRDLIRTDPRPVKEIAKEYGVSETIVYKYKREENELCLRKSASSHQKSQITLI